MTAREHSTLIDRLANLKQKFVNLRTDLDLSNVGLGSLPANGESPAGLVIAKYDSGKLKYLEEFMSRAMFSVGDGYLWLRDNDPRMIVYPEVNMPNPRIISIFRWNSDFSEVSDLVLEGYFAHEFGHALEEKGLPLTIQKQINSNDIELKEFLNQQQMSALFQEVRVDLIASALGYREHVWMALGYEGRFIKENDQGSPESRQNHLKQFKTRQLALQLFG